MTLGIKRPFWWSKGLFVSFVLNGVEKRKSLLGHFWGLKDIWVSKCFFGDQKALLRIKRSFLRSGGLVGDHKAFLGIKKGRGSEDLFGALICEFCGSMTLKIEKLTGGLFGDQTTYFWGSKSLVGDQKVFLVINKSFLGIWRSCWESQFFFGDTRDQKVFLVLIFVSFVAQWRSKAKRLLDLFGDQKTSFGSFFRSKGPFDAPIWIFCGSMTFKNEKGRWGSLELNQGLIDFCTKFFKLKRLLIYLHLYLEPIKVCLHHKKAQSSLIEPLN